MDVVYSFISAFDRAVDGGVTDEEIVSPKDDGAPLLRKELSDADDPEITPKGSDAA